MKVKSIRSLLWLGNLLVIAAICLLLVKIVMSRKDLANTYLPKDKIERMMRVQPTVDVRSQGGAKDWKIFDSCHTLNVTGKEPPPPEVTVEGEEVIPDLTPIETVLRVDMVFAGGPEKSFASIRYLEDGPLGMPPANVTAPPKPPGSGREPAKEAEELVRPGEKLRAPYDAAPYLGEVKGITHEGVVFLWGGEDTALSTQQMDRDLTGAAKTQPGLDDDPEDEAARAEAAEAARLSRKIHEHSWFIGTEERDEIIADHESLLNEIVLGTTFSKAEKRMLIKLNKVPEDSLAAAKGFEAGDIIHKINGERISSKSAVIQYFEQRPRVTSVNIDIERRGTHITKAFQIAQ